MAGYANGLCTYNFINEYKASCTVMESRASSTNSGNCDVDVDECASKPCANGAVCTSSAVGSIAGATVSVAAYRCTCKPGFANGMCGYTFIKDYAGLCKVTESSAVKSSSGNCDVDVDE